MKIDGLVQRLDHYEKLLRLDKPIGILLLLWPTLWALWLSADGIPMRLAGTFTNAKGKASSVRWELSGVKTGPQPAALFEPPAGLSKLPPEAIAPLLGLRLKGGGTH